VLLGWALLAGFAALLALQDIRANDYWWHLGAGRWMVENGAVPVVDPFSYTVHGSRWIDIHWLHQLLLYGVYEVGGHEANVLLKGLLVGATLFVLAQIGYRAERPAVSWLALTTLLVVASHRFMPRPELPSFLILAGELFLFDRFRRRPDSWIYGVVALQILWVNLHGLFAVGLVLCALHLVAEIFRCLLAPGSAGRREALQNGRILPLAVVTLLATLGSLANPNGLEGALYPLQQLGMVGAERGFLGASNLELQPLFGTHAPLPGAYLAAFALLALGSLAAMVLDWRRLHPVDWISWVAFAYLALGARRNAALFALVAAPIWVRCWNEWRTTKPDPIPALRLFAPLLLIAALALLCTDLWRNAFYDRIGAIRERGLGIVETFTPTRAVEWIAENQPPLPLAHGLDSGGYVIWRLYPEVPVMIDGRLEVYGPERIQKLWLREPTQLAALDVEYGFGSVLLLHGRVNNERLLSFLHRSLAWRLVYVDDLASIFVRADADAERFPAVDTRDPALFSPLAGPPGPADRQRRIGRARFLHAIGEQEAALAVWSDALERYPEIPHGSFRRAAMQLAAGQRDAGLATLDALLDDPETPGATLASAARLLVAAGEPSRATPFERESQRRGRESFEVVLAGHIGSFVPPGLRAPLAGAIGIFGALGLLAAQRRFAAPDATEAQGFSAD